MPGDMRSEAITPVFLLPLVADVILLLHVMFVGFVVLGLVLIVAGGLCGWSWVRNPWFRLAHVVAIGIVVVQSWFGAICPLTIWEMALRSQAEGATYSGTFIGYWLGRILYYQAPAWAFVVSYTLFGVLVLACWFWVRPRPLRGTTGDRGGI
jgi:hypothetical protein